MPTYKYPRAETLAKVIEQEIAPTLTTDDLAFKLMPIKGVNRSMVKFTQKDSFLGLMNPRGTRGQPVQVKKVGEKEFTYTPGRFSDYMSIDEEVLETKGKLADITGEAQSLDEEVMECAVQMKHRELERMKWCIWQAIMGSITVRDAAGNILFSDTYAIKTGASSTAWTNFTASTPVADLLAIKKANSNGAISYGNGNLIMSESMFDCMLQNRNEADLWGFIKGSGFQGPIGLEGVNRLFKLMGLPTIIVYADTENGYANDAGTWVQHVPNGKIIWIGARKSNVPLGNYQVTAHANLKGKSGSYFIVKDMSDKDVPARVEVHAGHNGGPAVEYPNCIILVTASAPF